MIIYVNVSVEELHLFDGDIVLSSEQRQELHWGSADGDVSSGASREARAVVKVSGKKWLDREIPYQLSSQLSELHQCLIQCISYQWYSNNHPSISLFPRPPSPPLLILWEEKITIIFFCLHSNLTVPTLY